MEETETVTKPESEKVKLKRRKSSKRPTRKHSIKVRRKRSAVRRSASSLRKGKKAVRSKSFIVKRRSFLRPNRWSTYLRDERKGGFQTKIQSK